MDKLMRMAQSVALFRSAHIRSSLNVLADSGSYRVLILVYNFDGGKGIRPNQVAEYFRCTRPYVSKIIKYLIRRDLVSSQPDVLDGRSYRLVCTASGRAIMETIMKEYLQVTRTLVDGLGEEKSARLVELLEEATRILED